MADPTIAGSTVTLLEITGGKFSASLEDETLDNGLADITALGALGFYLTLGGTFYVTADFFTMLSAIDTARAALSTIAIANVNAALDGDYYVLDFSFDRKSTHWAFTLQLVKAVLYTGSPPVPADYILKSVLTEIGDIIYASAVSTPAALAHGAAGQVLTSGGHGAAPSWTAAGAGDMTRAVYDADLDGAVALAEDLVIAAQEQGDLIYFTGAVWTRLAHDTAGYLLKSGGHGANPSWLACTAAGAALLDDAAAADQRTTLGLGTMAVAAASDYIAKALVTEQGDIIYASAASTPAVLAHGSAGDVLQSGGHAGNPSWLTPAWILKSILTEQGDLIYASGVATPATLAHGSAGDVLQSGGNAANPSWLTPAWILKTLLTEQGDVIYASAANTPAALPHANAGNLLQSGGHGANPSWIALGSIDHGSFTGLGDDDHTIYVKHALATAANDFVVASGAGAFVKKTLAETKTILGVDAATLIASGVVEIATAAEVTAGTDAGRAIAPDSFSGSDYGKRIVQIVAIEAATVITTGDGKAYFIVPIEMTGWNLVRAEAAEDTTSNPGTTTVQIRNATDGHDMLSTKITIDATELTSYTAATPSVVDGAEDDVATGDKLAVDVDVAGTGGKGLIVILTFQLP